MHRPVNRKSFVQPPRPPAVESPPDRSTAVCARPLRAYDLAQLPAGEGNHSASEYAITRPSTKVGIRSIFLPGT
jgi:hypothetical protein